MLMSVVSRKRDAMPIVGPVGADTHMTVVKPSEADAFVSRPIRPRPIVLIYGPIPARA